MNCLARISNRGRALAALAVTGLVSSAALAQDTPATFTDIVLPIDPVSMASKIFAVGGVVLLSVLSIWIGFRLIKGGGKAMGKGISP